MKHRKNLDQTSTKKGEKTQSSSRLGLYMGLGASVSLAVATAATGSYAYKTIQSWLAPVTIQTPALVKLVSQDYRLADSELASVRAPEITLTEVHSPKFKRQSLGVEYSHADLNVLLTPDEPVVVSATLKNVDYSERALHQRLTLKFYELAQPVSNLSVVAANQNFTAEQIVVAEQTVQQVQAPEEGFEDDYSVDIHSETIEPVAIGETLEDLGEVENDAQSVVAKPDQANDGFKVIRSAAKDSKESQVDVNVTTQVAPNGQAFDIASLREQVRQEMTRAQPAPDTQAPPEESRPSQPRPQQLLADASNTVNEAVTTYDYPALAQKLGIKEVPQITEYSPNDYSVPVPQAPEQQEAGPVAIVSISQGGKISVTPAAGAPGPQVLIPTPQQDSQSPASQAEVVPQVQAALTPVVQSSVPETRSTAAGSFSGNVSKAFSDGKAPVANARVQVLGSTLTTFTDAEGHFRFDDVRIQGVLPVVVSADGYLWRRVDLKSDRNYVVELLSTNGDQELSRLIGEVRPMQNGIIFGQMVDPEGLELSSYTVKLIKVTDAQTILQPAYCNEYGVPSERQTVTSARGQFVFSSVPSGTYLLVTTDSRGVERAPHIVRVGEGEGIVRQFSLGQKKVLTGRVFNAASRSAVLGGASVQYYGTLAKAVSAQDGSFELAPTYVDCEEINYLQFEREGFYRNRVPVQCGQSTQAFIFPLSHIDALSMDAGVRLDQSEALIMGHVSFREAVRMQLLGPEEMEPSRSPRGYDFYFGDDGLVSPSRERTSANGNFVITNAPGELSYIEAFNTKNRTLSIYPILTAPSTVNVHIQ